MKKCIDNTREDSTSVNVSIHETSQPAQDKAKYRTVSSLASRPCLENELECGPMPNLMVALPNTGGALCSTPQSLADAHY